MEPFEKSPVFALFALKGRFLVRSAPKNCIPVLTESEPEPSDGNGRTEYTAQIFGIQLAQRQPAQQTGSMQQPPLQQPGERRAKGC